MKRINIKVDGEIKLWVEMKDPTKWLQFHTENNTWGYLGEYEIEEIDITQDYALKELRVRRNKMLQDSDKYMISDYPISSQKRSEWVTYRQLLRDLTVTTEDYTNVEWPQIPQ